MHIYNQKLNGETHQCEVCGVIGQNVQHHVAGRRYDDRCIWVCVECHARIHANPEWAYKHNYLLKRGNNMQKAKKTKSCAHTKTMNRMINGKLVPVCLFCGQQTKEMHWGLHKPKKEVPSNLRGPKAPVTKMGFDKQDPRIAEAEKLKRRYVSLKRFVNRGLGTPEELKQAKDDMKQVESDMKKLQASYEE